MLNLRVSILFTLLVRDKYALNVAAESEKILVYDEIHKYSKWKQFLKGFYDLYGRNLRIVATGSAKMDVYKKGGDSMMGRYFPYRMHPLSVAELLDVSIPDERIVRSPKRLSDDEWTALLRFGGFPDPFVNRDVRFSRGILQEDGIPLGLNNCLRLICAI